MTRLIIGAVLAWLLPAAALAQSPPGPEGSRLWIVAGGAAGTVRGDCQECEQEAPYRHGGALVGNLGVRLNSRVDVGADLFWMKWGNEGGRIRTTAIDAVVQFRPWESKGFFVKAGAGMAFVKNYLQTIGPNPDLSKALSVVIGGGWTFNPKGRVGLQLFAMQHVGALGDLQTVNGTVADVTANLWSVGAAIVIR